jgi:hypothetical protein
MTPQDHHRPATPGHANLAVGWTCILFGLILGMTMGLWAFDGPLPAPAGHGDYGDVSRRLLRLSHIAWIALGLMNIATALVLQHWAAVGDRRPRRPLAFAATCLNLGNVFLPLTLLLAAWYLPLKYLMPLPASCVVAAAAVMTGVSWRRRTENPLEATS